MEDTTYMMRFRRHVTMDKLPPLLSGLDEDVVEEIMQHTR
jgi:hypothetical protein